ncbi:hypothetical protein [Actinoplanes subglobosus]|uniref:Transposase n=1 Tax=Actinoplanes subglobosus TaxID=1547892 RepID=A0ABV8IXS6_9ACTN
MTRMLRAIGEWAEPLAESWPDVCAFVTGEGPDPETVAYLRSGTVFVVRMTPWRCDLCGTANGQAVLTDGVDYTWPEGLAHYVEAHGVRLPVRLRGTVPPVDVGWFENAPAQHRRGDDRRNLVAGSAARAGAAPSGLLPQLGAVLVEPAGTC